MTSHGSVAPLIGLFVSGLMLVVGVPLPICLGLVVFCLFGLMNAF